MQYAYNSYTPYFTTKIYMSGHACTLWSSEFQSLNWTLLKVQYPGFLYTALFPVYMATPYRSKTYTRRPANPSSFDLLCAYFKIILFALLEQRLHY